MSLSNRAFAGRSMGMGGWLYEWAVERCIRIAGYLAMAIIVLIFFFLIRDSLPFVTRHHHSIAELFGSTWSPSSNRFGALPLIVGTAIVTGVSIAIALPLGIISATYLGIIAPPKVREVLKPIVELVAAIPSVVVGFIGVVVVGPALFHWSQDHGDLLRMSSTRSAMAASIMLAFMALPTIVSVAEDSIQTVPREYRDGALALGATRWETIWRVTIPAASSGIVAAVMLGIGRAIGETMTVLMVAGNSAQIPSGPFALFQPVRTMTAAIAAEAGETAQGGVHYSALFMIGLMLFLITFAVNLIAERLVTRLGNKR